MLTPKRGKISIFLASSPEIDGTNGKYFNRRKKAKSVKIPYDESIAT